MTFEQASELKARYEALGCEVEVRTTKMERVKQRYKPEQRQVTVSYRTDGVTLRHQGWEKKIDYDQPKEGKIELIPTDELFWSMVENPDLQYGQTPINIWSWRSEDRTREIAVTGRFKPDGTPSFTVSLRFGSWISGQWCKPFRSELGSLASAVDALKEPHTAETALRFSTELTK